MKRLLIMFIMLVTAFVMVGCNNETEKENDGKELLSVELSDIKEEDKMDYIVSDEIIKKDYLEYAKSNGEENLVYENIQIIKKYGQYDDIIILTMDRGAYQVMTQVSFMEVGISLSFSDTNTPLVYKDRMFYELKDAYNKGIIKLEHLKLLQDKLDK